MLYYDKIASKQWNNCRYWYFLDKRCKFQRNVSNACHDVLMISMNLIDNAYINIQGVDYHFIIREIAKVEP